MNHQQEIQESNIKKEMRTRNNIVALVMVLATMAGWAQQETIISQYWANMNQVNPAFVGSEGVTDVVLTIRDQWSGIPEAPQSQMMSFGTTLGNNVGIGISALRDKTFIENQTYVGIDFSYKIQMGDKTDLFLGLKAGGNFYDVNVNGLETYNIMADPSLMSINEFSPNVGIGFQLKQEKWFVGVSVPRMLNTERARAEMGTTATVATDRPHLYATAGYTFDLGKSGMWTVTPMSMLRYVNGAPVSMDVTAMFKYNDKIGFGATSRTDKALGLFANFNITENIIIGYAYESSTRAQLANANNTNEIMMSFKF
jgi:type IX secretion system PorP/SprF family membrane protein